MNYFSPILSTVLAHRGVLKCCSCNASKYLHSSQVIVQDNSVDCNSNLHPILIVQVLTTVTLANTLFKYPSSDAFVIHNAMLRAQRRQSISKHNVESRLALVRELFNNV